MEGQWSLGRFSSGYCGSRTREKLMKSDYSTDISDTPKGKRPRVSHVREGGGGPTSRHSCDMMRDHKGGSSESAADE